MSFDEFTGLPLAAMDLDNSTGLPGITDEVKRISLLSKTERQVELALKQAAYAEAQSGTLIAEQTILMTVSVTILHAIMGAAKACPHGSECKDWWFYLADFFHRAAKEAAAQDALMISKGSAEEAATNMELMGWGALDQEVGQEQSLEAKLGGMKI